jgi:hypothetical protein
MTLYSLGMYHKDTSIQKSAHYKPSIISTKSINNNFMKSFVYNYEQFS